MERITFLRMIGHVPPAAWDAIIPHSHRVLGSSRFERVALNPQPLPPREAITSGAADMAHEVARLAVEADLREPGSGARIANELIDDWCGTWWPRKWPWPWPGPTPEPEPGPYDVALGRLVGAVVFASVGSRLGEGDLQKVLLEGADRLAGVAAERVG